MSMWKWEKVQKLLWKRRRIVVNYKAMRGLSSWLFLNDELSVYKRILKEVILSRINA